METIYEVTSRYIIIGSLLEKIRELEYRMKRNRLILANRQLDQSTMSKIHSDNIQYQNELNELNKELDQYRKK